MARRQRGEREAQDSVWTERIEWQHVGYKFIVSHHPAGAGMAGSDCWDGGSEVGILASE